MGKVGEGKNKIKKNKEQGLKKDSSSQTKDDSAGKEKKAAGEQKGGIVLNQTENKAEPIKSKAAKLAQEKQPNWRDEVYDMLLQMRKELLRDVSQSIKEESDHLKFDVGDFYDHASNDRDRELALVLTDRDREKLQRVEDALRRIEEESYGICEICGDEIDKDRLMVMPFTKLCLSCQEDMERQGNE